MTLLGAGWGCGVEFLGKTPLHPQCTSVHPWESMATKFFLQNAFGGERGDTSNELVSLGKELNSLLSY